MRERAYHHTLIRTDCVEQQRQAMDFAAELETLRHTGGERLSPTGAARWLQHLTMPPVLLAQCLAVGSKVTQQAVQPIVIAQLPVDGRFGGQLDLADVLLGILQLLAIDVKFTQVCSHSMLPAQLAISQQTGFALRRRHSRCFLLSFRSKVSTLRAPPS